MSTNSRQSSLFSEDPAKKRTLPNDAHSLREMGLVRTHCVLPIALNEDIKSIARSQNMNADALIGEYVQQAASKIKNNKAQEEARRLREQFGDSWLEVLGSVKL